MTWGNAREMIHYAQEMGIRFEIANDYLVLDAPQGALSAELKDCLAKHKSEILEIIRHCGYTLDELAQHAGHYWHEIQKNEEAIAAFAEMLSEQTLLRAGQIPERYSAWTYCVSCEKQVPVPPSLMNDGNVLGCMHCHLQKEIH